MSAGYEFVPLPPTVRRKSRPEARWDRRCKDTFSGLLRVRLRAEQAVHIGSGFKRMQEDKVLRAAVHIQDGPGIPGSSLKGVLRSRYEAITRSCVQQAPGREHTVRSRTHRHIKKARLTDQALGEAVLRRRCDPKASCPACALFGCMSLRSRITVHDLVCPEDVRFTNQSIHEQFAPNLHHVGRAVPRDGSQNQRHMTERHQAGKATRTTGSGRGSGTAYFEVQSLYGRKLAVGMGPVVEEAKLQWIEVIPAGSIITGTIGLFNVLRAELGGLLAALGRMPAGPLKIGGGKGRGFGRMRLDHIEYELRDDAGHHITVDQAIEAGWRTEFEGWQDRWEDGELKLYEIHQGDC